MRLIIPTLSLVCRIIWRVSRLGYLGSCSTAKLAPSQSAPVTLTTVALVLPEVFAKPLCMGSPKTVKEQITVTRELHGILLLMVLVTSRETTSGSCHSHSPNQHYLNFSHYSSYTWRHSENQFQKTFQSTQHWTSFIFACFPWLKTFNN